MNKITILTICPEMFSAIDNFHVISRARSLGKLRLEIVDIRSFVQGSFRKVDDSPYGGGPGMILRIAPVMAALSDVTAGEDNNKVCRAVLSPYGRTYNQKEAHRLLDFEHLVLICGHYEGIDARIYNHVDRIISIGDYILSGGEIAAMAVADSLARLLPGVLKDGSLSEESFSGDMLEYPQYTRPAVFEGEKVPELLLSGNHVDIKEWREKQAVEMTLKYRPDLLKEIR